MSTKALIKIILSIVMISSLASANITPALPEQGSTQMNGYIGKNEINQDFLGQSDKQQRDIKTIKDYKDFEGDLQKAIEAGDRFASPYYLGLLYLTSFNLPDGEIKLDMDKASKYLKIAYDNGNYLAAYNISMIKLYNKDIDGALFSLDEAIIKASMDKDAPKSTKLFLSSVFASIIMQFKSEDPEAVKKGIIYLERYASRDTPTSLFILANLYHAIKNSEKSNLLLNIACDKTNPNADKQLVGLCGFYLARQIIPEDNNVSQDNVLIRDTKKLQETLNKQDAVHPLSAQDKLMVWIKDRYTQYKLGALVLTAVLMTVFFKARKKFKSEKNKKIPNETKKEEVIHKGEEVDI